MQDEQDPNAQGQQAVAETPIDNQGEQSSRPQQHEGFQRRIDEVVSARKLAEERAAQAEAQRDELVRALAAQAAQVAQRTEVLPPEPHVDIDPEERRRIEAVFRPQMSRIEGIVSKLDQLAAQQQYQQVVGSINDPSLDREAKQVLAQWEKGGYTGWALQDAAVFVLGQRQLKQLQGSSTPQAKARNAAGQFSSTNDGALANHAAPPMPRPDVNGARPTNFDQLPLDKRLELMEQRLEDKSF